MGRPAREAQNDGPSRRPTNAGTGEQGECGGHDGDERAKRGLAHGQIPGRPTVTYRQLLRPTTGGSWRKWLDYAPVNSEQLLEKA